MQATDHFPANRTEALARLKAFAPKAGRHYATRRNYDLGTGQHSGVSTLSPYIRTRLLTEQHVLDTVLTHHSPSAAEKFVQEVFWRTYWKGWLEMRPSVWFQYQSDLRQQINAVQTQSGLRREWEAACQGDTGIECFDHWAHELITTGYLHNHARMWFASIWIFTLGLPWQLGADFFLRHLLDGDPASNTLSWRWVAGIQTPGKTYLARTSNISKYTEGRFHPKWQLAREAVPISAPAHPDRIPIPLSQVPDMSKRSGLVIHCDDLSPGFATRPPPVATAILRTEHTLTPLHIAPHISAFHETALADCLSDLDVQSPSCTAHDAAAIVSWAQDNALEQIITPYAPVGPNATVLDQIERSTNIPVIRARRDYDSLAWPHATHGFFRFKDKIPTILRDLTQPSLAL